MSAFIEIRTAIEAARQARQAIDAYADDFAAFLARDADLRRVPVSTLRALKRQLGAFDSRTGKWAKK